MSGKDTPASKQDRIDQILVRVRSGIPLEESVFAVGTLKWFYTQLTKVERAPILRAYREHQQRLELVEKRFPTDQ